MNTQYALNVPLVFTCESSLLCWFLISRLVNSGRGLSHMRVYGRGHLCKNRTQRWAHHMGCRSFPSGLSASLAEMQLHTRVCNNLCFHVRMKVFSWCWLEKKRSYRFWNIHRVYARSVFVYCGHVMLPGDLERGGRTCLRVAHYLGLWHGWIWQFSCTAW